MVAGAAGDEIEGLTFLLEEGEHRHERCDAQRRIRSGGVQPPLVETKARRKNFANALVQTRQQHTFDSCYVLHP